MSLNVSKAKQLAGAAGRGDLRALNTLLRSIIDELDPALSMIALAIDTTLNALTHGNKNIIMGGAGSARTFTLPAATGSGVKYRFTVGAVNTSNYVIQVTGDDTMDGQIASLADGGDTLVGWETAAASDTITLNGTTKGGVAIGDWVELQDIATDQWSVTGLVTSSGVEATPFSAAV